MGQRKFESWTYQGFGYGGLLGRRIDHGKYHVIEFINWEELTGEDHEFEYYVELLLIDVLMVDPRTLAGAIESCGGDHIEEAEGEERYKLCVDSLYSCGHKARLGVWESNNGNKLIADATRESKRLERDPSAVTGLLDQQANKVGNTWRDFMTGKYGFKPAGKDLKHGPRNVLSEYVGMLERKLASKEAEITELKNTLQSRDLEAHGTTRLVQLGDEVRQ